MTGPGKRPRLLGPSKISELIVDTDSDGVRVSSNCQYRWGRFSKCARCVTTSTIPSNSQLSWVQQFNFIQCLWWRGCWWQWARWTDSTASNPAMDMLLLPSEKCSTHIYTGPQRKEGQWSFTHKWWLKSTFCILQKLSLLMVNNHYYHNYMNRFDVGPSLQPDITKLKCLCFWHRQYRWDKLTDYRAKMDQLYIYFYGTMMKQDWYLHILGYLHFIDKRNEPDRTDEYSDWLWKIRDLFEILNGTITKFYDPSKNLAIDKVIVSLKGRIIFKLYITKKCKCFSIKIFKLCNLNGYTWHESMPGEG